MIYEIVFTKSAARAFQRIPDPDYSKVKNTIDALALNPHPPGSAKLQGRNSYRVRQGDYRIIYHVVYQKLVIDIIAVGHRKDVYD